jgi:hypothetical protein
VQTLSKPTKHQIPAIIYCLWRSIFSSNLLGNTPDSIQFKRNKIRKILMPIPDETKNYLVQINGKLYIALALHLSYLDTNSSTVTYQPCDLWGDHWGFESIDITFDNVIREASENDLIQYDNIDTI